MSKIQVVGFDTFHDCERHYRQNMSHNSLNGYGFNLEKKHFYEVESGSN